MLETVVLLNIFFEPVILRFFDEYKVKKEQHLFKIEIVSTSLLSLLINLTRKKERKKNVLTPNFWTLLYIITKD